MKEISQKSSKTDENLVEGYLKSFDLKIEKYSKEEKRESKKPDFKVISKNGYFFLCEVKSILTKIGEKGILHKKVLSIITEKISEAIKQFNSVNKQHIVPNILVFATHCQFIDWKNYIEVLHGEITTTKPRETEKDTILIKSFESHEAYNRLKNNFTIIDLAIWLYRNEPKYIFTSEDQRTINKLSKIFKIKQHLKL